MSAESTLVFWGIKFELEPPELDACSTRSDPRQRKARASGLDEYWGNFGGEEELFLLFVGKRLGVLGAENASELALSKVQLIAAIEETNTKLSQQEFHEDAALHIVWERDF